MSNRDITELTWENGQLAMHEFGGIFPPAPSKGPTRDTLESVVHQGTISNKEPGPKNGGSVVASSGGRWAGEMNGLVKKRTRSESDQHCQVKWRGEEDISVCASANAAFCRESDKTMCTWASHESSRSTRTKTTDDDSACHGLSEGRATKSETDRFHIARKGRAAAVHNQSERRRRDRINQKMKALQKLVPNASKTDKASMLDEVIEYLKQLQAQVQLMSARSMMMPLGMQQQLQMSILARAGMGVGLGMGMGMLNMGHVAAHAPSAAQHQLGSFPTPPLFLPAVGPSSAPQQPKPDPATTSLVPLHDPYNAFLSQSMNMDMYNRMSALYGQQMNQSTKTSSSHMRMSPMQEG